MFHHNRGCCGDCCGTGYGNGTAAPSAEPIKEQPKKMPSSAAPAKEVRVITPPAQAPFAPAIQNAPAINAPIAAPRIIEGDVRNPF
jgi:hypothetical protein